MSPVPEAALAGALSNSALESTERQVVAVALDGLGLAVGDNLNEELRGAIVSLCAARKLKVVTENIGRGWPQRTGGEG